MQDTYKHYICDIELELLAIKNSVCKCVLWWIQTLS